MMRLLHHPAHVYSMRVLHNYIKHWFLSILSVDSGSRLKPSLSGEAGMTSTKVSHLTEPQNLASESASAEFALLETLHI